LREIIRKEIRTLISIDNATVNTIMHEFRSDLVGGGASLRIGVTDETCIFSVIWVHLELAGVVVVFSPSFSMIELSIACTNP